MPPFGFNGLGTDAPIIDAEAPAALALLNVTGLANGQHAFVEAMRTAGGPGEYILQDAISATPDAFFVVATADAPTRQWVYAPILEQGVVGVETVSLDLTVSPQTIVLLPPMSYLEMVILAPAWILTQRNGTVTTGPTINIGTDATFTDLTASGVQTALGAATVNARSACTGNVVANNNLDLTARGCKLQVTNPATLGTATAFKAKLNVVFMLSRNPI